MKFEMKGPFKLGAPKFPTPIPVDEYTATAYLAHVQRERVIRLLTQGRQEGDAPNEKIIAEATEAGQQLIAQGEELLYQTRLLERRNREGSG